MLAALALGCQPGNGPVASATPVLKQSIPRLELFQCPHDCKVPQDEEPFFGYTGEGDPTKELMKLKKAQAFDPDSPAVFHHQASELERLKRYQEAIDCESKAIKLKPGFAEALNGRAYYRTFFDDPKGWELAMEDIGLALRLDDAPTYYDTRGAILMKMGRLQEALRDFSIAATQSEVPEHLLHRVEVLRKLGREDEAERDLKRLKELEAEKKEMQTIRLEQ